MLRKIKVIVPSMLIMLILITVGMGVSSCKSQRYRDYKNYGKGYETAKKGGSKPSLWSSKVEKEGYEAGIIDCRSSNNISSSTVEFQYTEEELKSMENRWSTFEEILNDALKGDQDAIFSIGLCYLYGGKGLPIDITKANSFFSKAASLGHAPSIEKIRSMYLEDLPNPFLHNVYLNLVIALGHTEYTDAYHRTRSKMKENFGINGKKITDEIERIAGEKIQVIYANLDKLKISKKSMNSANFFLNLNGITLEDSFYDLSYWASLLEVVNK